MAQDHKDGSLVLGLGDRLGPLIDVAGMGAFALVIKGADLVHLGELDIVVGELVHQVSMHLFIVAKPLLNLISQLHQKQLLAHFLLLLPFNLSKCYPSLILVRQYIDCLFENSICSSKRL